MDGGKFFNRIQSGSFQHRCMAAALRVQHGPGWIGTVLTSMGISGQLQLLDQFTNRRKRKHVQDAARKISLKYKKQRLETRYSASVVNSHQIPLMAVYLQNQTFLKMNYSNYVENALREFRSLSSK